MDRGQRAELLRRAKEVRRDCEGREMDVWQTCARIREELPELSVLEAQRLAQGWSRVQAIAKISDLYAQDGIENPRVTTGMLCKWEHGDVAPDAEHRRVLCRLYGVTPDELGLRNHLRQSRAPSPPSLTSVVTVGNDGSNDESEKPMRLQRRTLIQMAGLAAVPLSHLQRLEVALALPAKSIQPETSAQVEQRLQSARRQFDAGALAALIAGFPPMLSAALATAEHVDTPEGWARLASICTLGADALNKIGDKPRAGLAAGWGEVYARRSESPLAMAASARAKGMMLRTGGHHDAATQVVERAAATLEVAGLRTAPQMSAHMRLMCTAAYAASQAGKRQQAFERLLEAQRMAKRLTALTGEADAETFVELYRLNINYALGDAGKALRVSRNLRPEMFRTPERRGRLYTDLARVRWRLGQPQETASALLAAYHEAPSEVYDRPATWRIAKDVALMHPRVREVRELTSTLAGRRSSA